MGDRIPIPATDFGQPFFILGDIRKVVCMFFNSHARLRQQVRELLA